MGALVPLVSTMRTAHHKVNKEACVCFECVFVCAWPNGIHAGVMLRG